MSGTRENIKIIFLVLGSIIVMIKADCSNDSCENGWLVKESKIVKKKGIGGYRYRDMQMGKTKITVKI